MEKLDNKTLMNINGGALSIGAMIAIGGAITFIIGLLDGFIRPLKCR